MAKAFRVVWALPILGVASAATAEQSASGTIALNLTVPLSCTVEHRAGTAASTGQGYMLGNLHEFCNDPRGYSLVVDYAPGTLRGANVAVGEERITLDGSGRAVVSNAVGPRIRDRELYVQPGTNGFDTDRLNFSIEAR